MFEAGVLVASIQIERRPVVDLQARVLALLAQQAIADLGQKQCGSRPSPRASKAPFGADL